MSARLWTAGSAVVLALGLTACGGGGGGGNGAPIGGGGNNTGVIPTTPNCNTAEPCLGFDQIDPSVVLQLPSTLASATFNPITDEGPDNIHREGARTSGEDLGIWVSRDARWYRVSTDPNVAGFATYGSDFDPSFPNVRIDSDFRRYNLQNREVTNGVSTLVQFDPTDAARDLNFTTFGVWTHQYTDFFASGGQAAGRQTAPSLMPTADTFGSPVTFSGRTAASYIESDGDQFDLLGNASMSVNFGNGGITGQFSGLTFASGGSVGQDWGLGNVDVSASVVGGNDFQGSTVLPLPGGSLPGSIVGSFYGPNAEEMGGSWTIDGTGVGGPGFAVVGAFGAAR